MPSTSMATAPAPEAEAAAEQKTLCHLSFHGSPRSSATAEIYLVAATKQDLRVYLSQGDGLSVSGPHYGASSGGALVVRPNSTVGAIASNNVLYLYSVDGRRRQIGFDGDDILFDSPIYAVRVVHAGERAVIVAMVARRVVVLLETPAGGGFRQLEGCPMSVAGDPDAPPTLRKFSAAQRLLAVAPRMAEKGESSATKFIVAVPAEETGHVTLALYDPAAPPGRPVVRRKTVEAHVSEIRCVALSPDGWLLATASVKGTLIRIFTTTNGTQCQELRRGTDSAVIYGMAFSQDLKWLAVSSDKGTVHVFPIDFELGPLITDRHRPLPDSTQYCVPGPLGCKVEWSKAQLHLPDLVFYVVAFGGPETVFVAGSDGSYYKCKVPAKGGEMELEAKYNILKDDIPQAPTPLIHNVHH